MKEESEEYKEIRKIFAAISLGLTRVASKKLDIYSDKKSEVGKLLELISAFVSRASAFLKDDSQDREERTEVAELIGDAQKTKREIKVKEAENAAK